MPSGSARSRCRCSTRRGIELAEKRLKVLFRRPDYSGREPRVHAAGYSRLRPSPWLSRPAWRPPRPSAPSSRACRSSSWAARRGTRSRPASRSWRSSPPGASGCRLRVAVCAGLQLDEGLGRLAAVLVLDADHGHLGDGGVLRRSPPRCGADRRCSPSR